MKLSIVIPIYNESLIIPELYKQLINSLRKDFPAWKHELIFVDDGSTDESFSILKKIRQRDQNVKLLQLSRNFGHHIAISAGIDFVTGDFVVMMDGDLQDRPEEIIHLYEKLQHGYDVVYAERVNKQFGFMKKILADLFVRIIHALIHEQIIINSTIFRIMTKQVVHEVQKLREKNRYLVGLIGWVGFKHGSQKVSHGKRFDGQTKYTFTRQIDLAMNAVLSFSVYPLRLVIKTGFFFVGLSFLMMVYIIINKIVFNRPVLGWSSLIFSILLLGGMQIIILGVIGEYVARNYVENKNRPLYVIKIKLL